ncbi:MAG: DUF503 domain-containing protein [Actinomycetota bacterium]|nr:DUF503 domain-containing protein [Actinomycetota bacterium]MDQ3647728.1 DUF503 domain-containing protein [Actinomycetota bacterium]
MAFVCLIRIHLHFPENGSLKGKRKELQSVKAQLHRRFGAAVAETDHHDLWQRAELSAALVGREAGTVEGTRDALQRWVAARYPEGSSMQGALVSDADLMDS